MKKLFWIVLVLLAAFLVYKYAFKKDEAAKEAPKSLAVSAHSEQFNQSVTDVLNSYYALSAAFVNWDSAAVNKAATDVLAAIGNFKADELKKDSSIYETALFPLDNSKNSLTAIQQGSTWEEKRRSFQDLSENLRMLLITIKYDQGVVYWQECPMAFGENTIGNWLSAEEKVINPYLGAKDPKYGATMLNCGETKEKINFSVPDTTVK
jgi:hypothetical protein